MHIQNTGQIQRPTFVIDESRARRNIAMMARKAQQSGIQLRPHFKTHQSAEIGSWFRDQNVNRITVSSLSMAEYFAASGWNDITLAIPVNLRELDPIAGLAERIRLGLVIDSEAVIPSLARRLTAATPIWIKIDPDYGRCGIHWQNHERITNLVKRVSDQQTLLFQGLLVHLGQTYDADSVLQIQTFHDRQVDMLADLKRTIADITGIVPLISIGDTPASCTVRRFEQVDEIRPGNFIFFDAMQWLHGVCRADELAAVLLCPVIGLYPQRNQIVIYGGAVHLSKDSVTMAKGERIFGFAALIENHEIGEISRQAPVIKVSQEHGVIQVPPDWFEKLQPGDLVAVYPAHSCLTADLQPAYRLTAGRPVSKFRLS